MKEKLQNGKILMGTMVMAFDSPDAMRMIAHAGLDWVFLDTESVYPDPARLGTMLGYAQMAGLPAVVRIPEICKTEVGRVLDLGAAGSSALMCARRRRPGSWSDSPAIIRRGNGAWPWTGPIHSTVFPASGISSSIWRRPTGQVMLICQIESLPGLEQLDAIAAVSGIDGLLIGPNDLTQAMGIFGQTEHPDFLAAGPPDHPGGGGKRQVRGHELRKCRRLRTLGGHGRPVLPGGDGRFPVCRGAAGHAAAVEGAFWHLMTV